MNFWSTTKYTFLFLLCFSLSCKKDSSVFVKKVSSVSNNSSAAIFYKDWIPDSAVCCYNTCLSIDLDSNGTLDVCLMINKQYGGYSPSGGTYYYYYTSISSLDTSAILVSGGKGPSFGNHTNLALNDSIDMNLTWEKGFGILSGNGLQGRWDYGAGHGYLGVRLKDTAGFRFGWLRIGCQNPTSLIMTAQGLNLNYNQVIFAGQTH